MMRRLFWLGGGVAAGALIVRRLTRAAQSFTPAGIAGSLSDSLAGLGDAIRDFADDVREAMGQREAELNAALAVEGGDLSGTAGDAATPPDTPR